jgi:hypothetical protein
MKINVNLTMSLFKKRIEQVKPMKIKETC